MVLTYCHGNFLCNSSSKNNCGKRAAKMSQTSPDENCVHILDKNELFNSTYDVETIWSYNMTHIIWVILYESYNISYQVLTWKTYCSGGKGDSRQLRSISPFCDKCEYESLDENSIDENGLKTRVTFLSKSKKLQVILESSKSLILTCQDFPMFWYYSEFLTINYCW